METHQDKELGRNSPNITKIVEKGQKTKDKKSICNAFNGNPPKWSSTEASCSIERRKNRVEISTLYPFTLREFYNVIYNLHNNKAPGPGYINTWALKSGNYAPGTSLPIIFND